MTSRSRDLVEQHLDRIASVDPMIRAVCTVDPTARDQADALDLEAADGKARGPLHGIPVLVKDNSSTGAVYKGLTPKG